MASVETLAGELTQLELHDDDGNTARIAPERGAIVTSLRREGHELLYLDMATLLDRNANVRGGIPVLFPSPGRLRDDRWHQGGQTGVMKQHGFARQSPFECVERGTTCAGGGASVTLRLQASAATLSIYPWTFTLDLTFTLDHGVLTIDQRIANAGDTPMPFGIGFHPYFFTPQNEKSDIRIPTNATRVFNNITKQVEAFRGFDLAAPEVDAHLLDHGLTHASLLRTQQSSSVTVRGSTELRHWVVWALGGKDFVCLEPWTCPADALTTGDGLQWVAAGGERRLQVVVDRA